MRLEIFQRHDFQVSEYVRDAEYPGNRQTTDLHLRQFLCKALLRIDLDAGAAVTLLAGSARPSVRTRVLTRMERFMDHLAQKLDAHLTQHPGDIEALKQAMISEYKRYRESGSLIDALNERKRGRGR